MKKQSLPDEAPEAVALSISMKPGGTPLAAGFHIVGRAYPLSPKLQGVKFFGGMLLVWMFGWLYIGTAWNPKARVAGLSVAVLNCDTGLSSMEIQQVQANLGLNVARLASIPLGTSLLETSIWNSSSTASRLFQWHNFTCSAFTTSHPTTPGCPGSLSSACLAELKLSILRGHYWAALFIPANLTTNTFSALNSTTLNSTTKALNTPGTTPIANSYSHSQYTPVPLYYIKSSGRHVTAYSFLDGAMRVLWQRLSSGLAGMFAADTAIAGRMNPFFYISPLPLVMVDLAPVNYFGQHLGAFMLQLITWIATTLITVVTYDPLHDSPTTPLPLSFTPTPTTISLSLFHRFLKSACLSLLSTTLIMLIPIFLGINSTHGTQFSGYNAGYAIAFLWYCSWSYLGLNRLVVMIFGPAENSIVSSFLLILQLAASASILPHELSNSFFKVGYALPFTWGVRGMRTIFFGSGMGEMWENWAVITAWNVVCVVGVVGVFLMKVRRSVKDHNLT